MNSSDDYYTDLSISWLVRLGMLIGIVAILAIVLSGCSRDGSTSVLPFNKVASDTERPPLSLGAGEAGLTRNELPYNKECHEKSDSSLTKTLE